MRAAGIAAVFTKRVENNNAFGPQSHGVGPCSEGWLKSWLKSVLQSTRSTTGCPALGGYPEGASPNSRWFVALDRDVLCPLAHGVAVIPGLHAQQHIHGHVKGLFDP